MFVYETEKKKEKKRTVGAREITQGAGVQTLHVRVLGCILHGTLST